MRLRTRILIYLAALHALLAVLSFDRVREAPYLLLALELFLVLSLVVALRLTRAFFVPLELVRTGAELIQERDFTSRFQPLGQPEMDQLIAVYNRMIDQLRDERLRLRERNELFDRVVAATPGGIVLCDLDGRVDQLNPGAERLIGKTQDELTGRSLNAIPGSLGQALEALAVGASQVVALHNGRRVRCQRAEFRDRGFARSFYLIEELTEELRRSEKAAYEKLIRMVSHEVNNSVTSVSSLLMSVRSFGSALDDGDHGKFDRSDFERALDVAATRMEHLGAFINGFADVVRLPEPERRPQDMEALLDDVMTLLNPSFEERRIRLVRRTQERLFTCSIDKNQIEQVLLNVLKNAAEAIGEDGEVVLTTGREGPRCWLEITDTGPGIPDAARDQLFTPFFTTKANGCGLGLMIVKEVLVRHGFEFALENREAGGALFRIVF